MALVPNEKNPAKESYSALLGEIKERIRSTQYAALRAVSLELLSHYWDIGPKISTPSLSLAASPLLTHGESSSYTKPTSRTKNSHHWCEKLRSKTLRPFNFSVQNSARHRVKRTAPAPPRTIWSPLASARTTYQSATPDSRGAHGAFCSWSSPARFSNPDSSCESVIPSGLAMDKTLMIVRFRSPRSTLPM